MIRKSIIASLALAIVALGASTTIHAQEDPTTLTMSVEPYNCGRVSSPLYCYGLPININGVPAGSLWLDTFVTGYNAGTGFVLFNNVADLGQGNVTGDTILSTNSAGQITSLLVNFTGKTNDGDNGTYTGTMTLTFSYYYSAGGGGRGGAGAGWRFICTGGTVTINYN